MGFEVRWEREELSTLASHWVMQHFSLHTISIFQCVLFYSESQANKCGSGTLQFRYVQCTGKKGNHTANL